MTQTYIMLCMLCTATESYNVTESDENCSIESVARCRGLVTQSPDLTVDNIDQLCQ